MERAIVQSLEAVRSADFLSGAKGPYIGASKLAGALFGLAPLVNGLACSPGPGLTVSIAVGEIYTMAAVDSETYGSLPADSHQVLKQGILMDAATLSCPAASTVGDSINYLIEAQLQSVDTSNTSVPFYNASNSEIPNYNNTNTIRRDICAVQVKAGTQATTGTQTTPAADAGWTGLYSVTVHHGDSSISSGAISTLATAPFLGATLSQLTQLLVAGGTANATVLAFAPVLAVYRNGFVARFRATANNTGAVTLDAGPGAVALKGASGSALAPGDIRSGSDYSAIYDGPAGHWRLTTPAISELAGVGLIPNGSGALTVDINDLPAISPIIGTEELLAWNGALGKVDINSIVAQFTENDAFHSELFFLGLVT